MRKEIVIPIAWFAASILIALLLVSCKTRSAGCEAYGHNNIEYGDISEDETS